MWEDLPTDLIMQVGQFLHHRDARCMHATCTNWEDAWTSAGLSLPHPDVQHIEICDKLYCTNRQHIIDEMEPLILVSATETSETLRVLQFMMLLIPIKITSYISHRIGHKAIESVCIQLEKSMVFWCNCSHYEDLGNMPVVHFKSVDAQEYTWLFMDPDHTNSLCVWIFLVVGSISLLFIPSVMLITLVMALASLVYVIRQLFFLFW